MEQLGIFARIELHEDSCNREKVAPITTIIGLAGEGRDGTNYGLVLNTAWQENMANSAVNVMDLAVASSANLYLPNLSMLPSIASTARKISLRTQ